jgi:hypothetical protein
MEPLLIGCFLAGDARSSVRLRNRLREDRVVCVVTGPYEPLRNAAPRKSAVLIAGNRTGWVGQPAPLEST